MAPCRSPRPDAMLCVSFGSRPGASWRGVRPLEAPGFSRGRCHSHDSTEHMKRVLELANRLRQEGIECHLDRYVTMPPEGWPKWMERQIALADYVIVVCTET